MELLNEEPRKLFRKYLIPAVAAEIVSAIYGFVDTIVVGQSEGSNGAAASSIVLPIFTIAAFISLFCGVGGSVLMGKAIGEGESKKGDAYFTASLIYFAIITCIFWILGSFFQTSLYRLLGADDVLMPYVFSYGKWIFAAFPSFAFVSYMCFFIRADGSPKYVMIVTIIGGIINMIGDVVLVFPLGMGMQGAAIATVAGSVVQSIMLLGYILLGKTKLRLEKPFKLFTAISKISVIGIGAGISEIATTVVILIINNQIMKYSGSVALAVYGVLSTIAALFLCIYSGVGHAAQPIVSTNFGAGYRDRYTLIGKIGMQTAIIFGIVSFVLCAGFPKEIIRVFIKETPEVIQAAPYIIRVYAVSFVPLAVNMFAVAYLQSISRPISAMVVSLLRGVVLTSILLYVFPLFLGGNGIWWAVTAAESVTAAVALVCIKHGNKK